MHKQEELTQIVWKLCASALKGVLTLQDFYASWPEAANDSPFLRQAFLDIEDGLEHLPGSFLRGNVLLDEWRKTKMYQTIYLDCALLHYNRNSEELVQCRDFVLRQRNLSEEIIDSLVRQRMGEM